MCRDSEYRGNQREELRAAYEAAGIVEHRLATSDGDSPPANLLQKAVDLFFGARRRGAVAVHCLGGRERSATIAAAIRTRLVGEPPEDAVDAIQAVAADVCPLPNQMRTLVDWAAVSP
jgi:protein-tyrosine phosphatase